MFLSPLASHLDHTPNAIHIQLAQLEQLIQLGETIPVWCVVRETQRDDVFSWRKRHLPSASLSAYGEHMMFWERAEQFNGDFLGFLETVEFTK